MTIAERLSQWKVYFQTNKYPTQPQFWETLEAIAEALAGLGNIGASLFHNPSIDYPAMSAVLTLEGIWFNANPVGQGVFNSDQWELLFSFNDNTNLYDLGIAAWTFGQNVNAGQQKNP